MEFGISTSGLEGLQGNFKDLSNVFKKKKITSIQQCGLYVMRFVRARIPQKKTGYAHAWSKNISLFLPTGEKIDKTPSQWMKGKKAVAANQGRGGRKVITPQNNPKYIFNKSSQPQGMPIAHPLTAGSTNYKLRESIFYKIVGTNGLIIYCDPYRLNANYRAKGFTGSEMDMNILEYGGSYSWSRRYISGYRVWTAEGTVVHQGGGKIIAGKKQNDGEKFWRYDLKSKGGKQGRWVNKNALRNKSGRTQKTHYRKFAQPHVVAVPLHEWKRGSKNMAPRPFLRPAIRAFIRNQWPNIWQDLCTVQTNFNF